MNQMTQKYDLEERTTRFSERVMAFCASLRINHINRNVVDQLLRSATSIGANYAEANGASSKSDFRNKVHIAKKEARESQYWLRLLSTAEPARNVELRQLWQEAHEFVLIFQKITTTLKR
jgi:four helix bundle protein